MPGTGEKRESNQHVNDPVRDSPDTHRAIADAQRVNL